MKIIQHGINPATQSIQATCNNCHTVFEFHPLEEKYHSDQRDGDCYSIACPVCNKTVYKNVNRGAYPYG